MFEQKPKKRINFFVTIVIIAFILVCVVTVGVIGGIVGYTVAFNAQPQQTSVSELTPMPVLQSNPTTILPDTIPHNELSLSENEALITAVELVNPATVTVLNYSGSVGGMSSGSGIIIDAAGYIVTNNHVVESARELEVIFSHGGRVPAQLVGRAPDFDLAVLKIDASQVPAVASLGNSSALRLGERVAAIGSALGGFRNTVTSGVVSAHNRTLGDQRGLLQTDTPINHGNSGGPLINLYGEVIGINVMVLRGSGYGGDVAEGLGFAIPSNTVKTVAKQLIEKGYAEMPFLGISYLELNPQLSVERNLSVSDGVLIERVLSGTAAANVGLQAGDIILALNDQVIDDQNPLSQLLLQYSVGEEITVVVARDSQQLEVVVALGKRPN